MITLKFVNLFPIFVLDVCRQFELLKTSVQDVKDKPDFTAAATDRKMA